MLIDYISSLERVKDLCDEFEESILELYFEKGKAKESSVPDFVLSRQYQEDFMPIKACIELCRILKPSSLGDFESLFFKAASHLEDPRYTRNSENFKFFLKGVRLGFDSIVDDMSFFCLAFDEEEKKRMNEAIHNCLENCNYSCVAMSVSAVESRLLKLMCRASPVSERELEEKTLGQLIYEYIKNKEKYKNVVPEKHEPLLQLCNVYRTFSVHPKKQEIKGTIANSILSLSIEFLTDQDTKPEIVEARLISREGGK